MHSVTATGQLIILIDDRLPVRRRLLMMWDYAKARRERICSVLCEETSSAMHKNWVEAIGWVSTAILLATLLRQVYTEWKARTTAGLSKWLFTGQVAASVGFSTYSFLLGNWVFMGSNLAILAVAILGQVLYARNRRLHGGPR